MSDSDGSEEMNGMPTDMDFQNAGFGEQGPPQTEEHMWTATLSKDNKIVKFDGCDDAESTLILRRATLDVECEDEGRHIIQVISLDHEDNRITGSLCSLKLNGQCTVSLDGLSASPPTAFKLVKGNGPITLIGNLIKEIDQDLMPDDEVEEEMDDEDVSSEEEVENDEGISSQQVASKIKSIRNGVKRAAGDSDTDSNDCDESPAKKQAKSESPKKVDAVVKSEAGKKKGGKKEHKKFGG